MIMTCNNSYFWQKIGTSLTVDQLIYSTGNPDVSAVRGMGGAKGRHAPFCAVLLKKKWENDSLGWFWRCLHIHSAHTSLNHWGWSASCPPDGQEEVRRTMTIWTECQSSWSAVIISPTECDTYRMYRTWRWTNGELYSWWRRLIMIAPWWSRLQSGLPEYDKV